MTLSPNISHRTLANSLRCLVVDAIETAKSGHPGMPMGMADVATVLFSDFLKFDAQCPHWLNRDRFVLSAGHGSMLLYALNYLTGYKGMSLEDIKHFRQLGFPTAGHPERDINVGIETTTGPLGQGLGNAVGFAVAEEHLRARLGSEMIDHYTYVMAGDGCLMEGISQEVMSFAGHQKLRKLIVLFDDNQITIDGATSLATSDDTLKRFEACQWHVQTIDGHNNDEIRQALTHARESDKPSFIACKTTIGYGAPTKQGRAESHGAPLGTEETKAFKKSMGWVHEPFDIPEDILKAWRRMSHTQARKDWDAQFSQETLQNKAEDAVADIFHELQKEFVQDAPTLATRQSSQKVLDKVMPYLKFTLGGSADLTGSNLTKATSQAVFQADNREGPYIHYGIREHGMGAIMNGIALHSFLKAYGGTFLVFSDYLRPAVRLSALMEVPVTYVFTHDSIGLGEDGPTHQPVEHLAALRAIPNLWVMRPADAKEVAECWQLALTSQKNPVVLALSRQAVPLVSHYGEGACAQGAYILKNASGRPQVTLIATGSEVQIALDAAEDLEKRHVKVQVVSMPCWELFEDQDSSYQEKVLPPDTLRIAVEAALGFGWERYISDSECFIGMHSFGASGPGKDLYRHFGITKENVVQKALEKLDKRNEERLSRSAETKDKK